MASAAYEQLAAMASGCSIVRWPASAASAIPTRNPARAMGTADSLGTVEVGKLADLVLLDADPLADIANTQRIRAVVTAGRLYRRADLDGLVENARGVSRRSE